MPEIGVYEPGTKIRNIDAKITTDPAKDDKKTGSKVSVYSQSESLKLETANEAADLASFGVFIGIYDPEIAAFLAGEF